MLATRLAGAAEDLSFIHPDGINARHQALRIEQAASQRYSNAVKALSDLVLARNSPTDFSARVFASDVGRGNVREASETISEIDSGACTYFSLANHLFAERAWFTALLASISDGLIASDANGCVCFLNSAAQTLTGWSLEDANGKAIEQVYRVSMPTGQPLEEYQLRTSLRTGAPTSKQNFALRARAGNEIQIEASAAPIIEGGRAIGGVVVFLDNSVKLRKEQNERVRRERLEDEARGSTEAVEQSNERLLALSARLIAAQEEERRRVARELHDDLSQHVSLAGFEAARIAQLLPEASDEVQERIQGMLGHIHLLNVRLHEIAYGLHPSILEDLGLAAAIRLVAQEYRTAGLDIRITISDTPADISISVATTLYRIAQEALRNAHKYAAGSIIRLTLNGIGKELYLTVEDTGPGFDPLTVRHKGGLGLLSMEERARLAGGSLKVHSKPGSGTLLLVRVPAQI
jgi:PAS domain S-box-containing protein